MSLQNTQTLNLDEALCYLVATCNNVGSNESNTDKNEKNSTSCDLEEKAQVASKQLLTRVVCIPEPVQLLCLDDYVKIMQIGQGAYGDVWLAQNYRTEEVVALKKLKLNEEREGFPKSSIREISLLRYLDHPNIVKFLGIAHSKPSTYEIQSKENAKKSHENILPIEDTKLHKLQGYVWLVFEYLPYDLTGVIDQLREQNKMLTIPEIKIIFSGIMRALDHCHSRNVVHRDLKSANLLITSDGLLKVADFGLSRLYNNEMFPMTNRVITLWYRPPELLLGSDKYTLSVDIWSAGCILAELILNKAIFTAEKENKILKAIMTCLGNPTDDNWPDRKSLPLWNVSQANPFLTEANQNSESIDRLIGKPNRTVSRTSSLFWSTIFERVGKSGVDLLKKMLCYNPEYRLTAKQILAHPWINEILPDSKINLSRFNRSNCHAFIIRRDRELSKKGVQRAGNNTKKTNDHPPSPNFFRRQCPRILSSTTYLQKLLAMQNENLTKKEPLQPINEPQPSEFKRQKLTSSPQKVIRATITSDDGGMMDLEDDDIERSGNVKSLRASPVPLPPQSPPPLPLETPPTIPVPNVPAHEFISNVISPSLPPPPPPPPTSPSPPCVPSPREKSKVNSKGSIHDSPAYSSEKNIKGKHEKSKNSISAKQLDIYKSTHPEDRKFINSPCRDKRGRNYSTNYSPKPSPQDVRRLSRSREVCYNNRYGPPQYSSPRYYRRRNEYMRYSLSREHHVEKSYIQKTSPTHYIKRSDSKQYKKMSNDKSEYIYEGRVSLMNERGSNMKPISSYMPQDKSPSNNAYYRRNYNSHISPRHYDSTPNSMERKVITKKEYSSNIFYKKLEKNDSTQQPPYNKYERRHYATDYPPNRSRSIGSNVSGTYLEKRHMLSSPHIRHHSSYRNLRSPSSFRVYKPYNSYRMHIVHRSSPTNGHPSDQSYHKESSLQNPRYKNNKSNINF